jgi:hypothetical protein
MTKSGVAPGVFFRTLQSTSVTVRASLRLMIEKLEEFLQKGAERA